MAVTATAAPYFVSTRSHESRPKSVNPVLSNPSADFRGLRPLKAADSLQMRLNTKPIGSSVAGTVKCSTGGMNLVFIGTEMGPYSKTDGLGEVYRPPSRREGIGSGLSLLGMISIRMHGTLTLYLRSKSGIKLRLFASPIFTRGERTGCLLITLGFLRRYGGELVEKLYGPVTGTDYDDNQLRFSLLCLAALEAPRILTLNNSKYFSGPYVEDVIFIATDWHTGPLSCYLKSMFKFDGIYKSARVAFLHS